MLSCVAVVAGAEVQVKVEFGTPTVYDDKVFVSSIPKPTWRDALWGIAEVVVQGLLFATAFTALSASFWFMARAVLR